MQYQMKWRLHVDVKAILSEMAPPWGLDCAIQTNNFLYMGKCKNHILHRIYELMRIYTGLKSKF